MNYKFAAVRTSKPRLFYTRVFQKKVIVAVVTSLLIALFVYAAYNKLIAYKAFVGQLRLSPITHGFENILAWLVPSVELLISGLLIFPRSRIVGLWMAFLLMLLFTVYVYVIPHFFALPTCSCGGIISAFSWKQHFWFNLGFTLLAALGLSVFPSHFTKNK